jgi:ATP-binding cassette subfamily F protein uup
MAVISLSSAQLAFGHVALLDHAEFSLETGERVGLIGRNGTGKSSLLKIISGKFKLDDGLLVMQQNLKIVYVEQEPCSSRRCRCTTRWRPGWANCRPCSRNTTR